MNNPNNSGLNLDSNFNEYRGFAASVKNGTAPTAAARAGIILLTATRPWFMIIKTVVRFSCQVVEMT